MIEAPNLGGFDVSESEQALEQEQSTFLDQPDGVDWLLAYIITLAEKEIELSLTVSVGGQLIAGRVAERERIEREDRGHFRNSERLAAKFKHAEARLASANTNRERRRARNRALLAAG